MGYYGLQRRTGPSIRPVAKLLLGSQLGHQSTQLDYVGYSPGAPWRDTRIEISFFCSS